MTSTTDTALAWAERAWARGVRDVRPLRGGWTSTMLGLVADHGERSVLRLMTKEPWRTHAPGLLAREAAVQLMLAGTPLPAPASIAVDPDGSRAGTPAHLMSWLPGAVDLSRDDDDFLGALAGLLAEVHRVDPGPERPRDYQSWAVPAKRVVPPWAGRPGLWSEAFDVLAGDPPPFRGTFLHRDFHLGNVLWAGGEVSGLVDWVETSWGPAALDVAHASTYLAMLHGPTAAHRFAAAHRAFAGEQADPGPERYWRVLDAVGYLPDPGKVAQPWRDQGLEISDALACARLEDWLAAVLG